MKLLKIIMASMTLLIAGTCDAKNTVDTYKFTMTLKVPRIYNNTESLGYRKYNRQKITGFLKITYKDYQKPKFEIVQLVNKTHKINGTNITYTVTVDNNGEHVYPKLNYIGDNKTGVFKKASTIFYFDADPSYNIGADEPDNTLLITLSGSGNSKYKKNYRAQIINTLGGTVAGAIGCGCRAYGHVSPTRVAGPNGPTDMVDDIATVEGTWKAVFYSRDYVYVDYDDLN